MPFFQIFWKIDRLNLTKPLILKIELLLLSFSKITCFCILGALQCCNIDEISLDPRNGTLTSLITLVPIDFLHFLLKNIINSTKI
jgi:hypothetical protein